MKFSSPEITYIIELPTARRENYNYIHIHTHIYNIKLKAGLLSNASPRIHPLTFINKALYLSGGPFVASTASR